MTRTHQGFIIPDGYYLHTEVLEQIPGLKSTQLSSWGNCAYVGKRIERQLRSSIRGIHVYSKKDIELIRAAKDFVDEGYTARSAFMRAREAYPRNPAEISYRKSDIQADIDKLEKKVSAAFRTFKKRYGLK